MKIESSGLNREISETEKNSIENSIGTIASTPFGTAPFIRNMGIRDYPPKDNSGLAQNRYAAEVITQCGIWEDRAQPRQVTFNNNNEVRVVIEYAGR